MHINSNYWQPAISLNFKAVWQSRERGDRWREEDGQMCRVKEESEAEIYIIIVSTVRSCVFNLQTGNICHIKN